MGTVDYEVAPAGGSRRAGVILPAAGVIKRVVDGRDVGMPGAGQLRHRHLVDVFTAGCYAGQRVGGEPAFIVSVEPVAQTPYQII